MPNVRDQLGNLRIAAPCPTSWEGMAGDERIRHCTLCNLNVYNFAEMTRDEVRELLARTEGRVCARLYRRADGTVLTRDCPTGLRALRRRASRIAAAFLTMLFSLPALAFGGTSQPRLKMRGSKVKLQVEQVASSQPAVFSGVVGDEVGTPLPGVTVVVRNEATKKEVAVVTNVDGSFNISSLSDGLYRVEVMLPPYKTATIQHLLLKAGEVTHANVAMRLDVRETITVGALADPLSMNDGISTTFTQDFINKLPM